jgi:serine/threonine protein phosphatase PrpC
MAIALRYAARSDVGLGRYKNNQDSGYAGPHLLVVADGMGGHAGGDVASSIAIGQLAALDGESHGPEAVRLLEEAIAEARDLVLRRVREDPELAGMGTTVTALLRSGRRLVLAHIGDSRAYLLRDGEISQVTHDHTFVQHLVDEGRITAEEADRHPQRSVIMRVLGDVESDGAADVSVREAQVGDRWLLCSDGLSGVVSTETLRDTLAGTPDPGECADQLIQLALRAGAPDNVTCIVADVVEAATAPPSNPEVVGSAAARRDAPSGAASGTPAAKAAALTAQQGAADQEPDAETDEDEERPPRGRAVRRVVAAVLVAALLVGGGYAAYAWSQQQYYVGESTDDVAIYRGLTQDVGPVRLSQVYERQDLPVDTLPVVWQERVGTGIVANDLPDARRIVRDLRQRSRLCDPVPAPAPAPAPAATAGGPAAPAPPATPTPTPTSTLPEGCEEGAR